LRINGTKIGDAPYVVAEIGCNHDGDFDKCLKMIEVAADCGVSAVKLQKRTPEKLFTREVLDSYYDSPNSHGATYGEHRAALDWFGTGEFHKISLKCGSLGVDFICTPFTSHDAEFLHNVIGLDAFKIASCDLTNIPLIEQVIRYGKPVIISTGGGSEEDILRLKPVIGLSDNVAVLHCVSSYPNGDDLNLGLIPKIRDWLMCQVGFSSHHPGLLPMYVAYMQGARIFEAHFTLNRGSRGTDHGFSLEPDGLSRLCEDLNRISGMVGTGEAFSGEKEGFVKKMGKSVYSARSIKKGAGIVRDDLCLMAPAVALEPYEINDVVGRLAIEDIPAKVAISWSSFI